MSSTPDKWPLPAREVSALRPYWRCARNAFAFVHWAVACLDGATNSLWWATKNE